MEFLEVMHRMITMSDMILPKHDLKENETENSWRSRRRKYLVQLIDHSDVMFWKNSFPSFCIWKQRSGVNAPLLRQANASTGTPDRHKSIHGNDNIRWHPTTAIVFRNCSVLENLDASIIAERLHWVASGGFASVATDSPPPPGSCSFSPLSFESTMRGCFRKSRCDPFAF